MLQLPNTPQIWLALLYVEAGGQQTGTATTIQLTWFPGRKVHTETGQFPSLPR